MIAIWIGIGISLAVILLIVINWKRQYVFVLTLTQGKLQLTYGQIDDVLFEDIQRICKLFNVRQGQIKAVQGTKGLNILCTGDIQAQQQAIRNALDYPL